jgi:hypothetical protein
MKGQPYSEACNFRHRLPKAELLQLKPHPFICQRHFVTKKVGNRKN